MPVVIVKEHFFSIGIAVLLLMTLYYGVNAVAPPPNKKAFFSDDVPRYMSKADPKYTPALKKRVDETSKNYMEAWKRHRGVVCSMYITAGLLILLIGSFWLKLELLSTAFIFGGLFMLITAIASGWESYPLRFIASMLTLLAVIWIVKRCFRSPTNCDGR